MYLFIQQPGNNFVHVIPSLVIDILKFKYKLYTKEEEEGGGGRKDKKVEDSCRGCPLKLPMNRLYFLYHRPIYVVDYALLLRETQNT